MNSAAMGSFLDAGGSLGWRKSDGMDADERSGIALDLLSGGTAVEGGGWENGDWAVAMEAEEDANVVEGRR
jgi:hypothetical protein